MMRRIQKAIADPLYALHIFRRRYLKFLFEDKVFAHKAEYRSDSENGEYSAAVINALRDQKAFDNFKRNPEYREILEHLSEAQGHEYLKLVLSRNDGLLSSAMENVFKLDEIGNPIKYQYEGFDIALSPTTLRYIKVASDLNGLFGKSLNRIAEIGCGYGGQTLVNDQLLKFKHATLFDLPFVNDLIKRYLNTMLLDGAYRTTTINEEVPGKYDLVISNYAFSELPSALQVVYIQKVLANSERGYLTMNSGLGSDRDAGKLSLHQLQTLLPTFEIFEEEPLTYQFNYIIVWGHDREFSKKHLRVKEIKL